MRSDYILYVVAVICFVIAGVFVALGTSEMNLIVTAIFFILGTIFAVGGYVLRPKATAPMPTASQPPSVESYLPSYQPPPQLPPVEEKIEAPAVPPPVVEEPTPAEEVPVVEPAPPPVEEVAPTEPTPVEEAPEIEHIPPPAEEMAPTEPTPVPAVEESAKCPRCGTEVSSPRKKWTMAGRPDKSGMRMQLEIGLFDCPKDKKPFRAVLSQKKV